MKRVLVLSLRCILVLTCAALFASSAFAGPYFVVENEGLTVAPSLVVGWDFDAPFVDFTNLSISGDFYVKNDDLAVYPTPWIGGYELGFAFANPLGRDVFEIGMAMDVELLPVPWPDYVELQSWTTTIDVAGYPSDVVTIYGAIALEYDVTNPPGPPGWVGIWNFTPSIGLECHW